MRILGLDVGSRQIKGTLLERGLLKRSVKHAFLRPITSGPLLEQLKAAVAEEAPKVDLVVMSISREPVIIRNMSLPFKDLRKVAAVIPGQVEANIPFPLRDAVVRHLITDESAAGQTHVMALVLKKADLDVVTGQLAALGVPESTAAIDSLGVVNAWLAGRPPGDGVGLVDVGAKKTVIEIVSNGRLLFSRQIGLAGDAFTAAIAAKAKVTPEEAEQLKIALSATPDDLDAATQQVVREALAESYLKLARELKRSILSARSLFSWLDVKEIKLCGGSALSAGIVDAVAVGAAMPVAVLRPSALEGTSDLARDPTMVASVGLALTGARAAVVEVDFPARPRDIVRYHRREIVLVVGLLLALLLGSYGSARRQLAQLREENDQIDAQIEAGLKSLGEMTRGKVEQSGLDAVAARMKKLRSVLSEDTASRLALVNEISAALPPNAEITFRSLNIERNAVEIEAETDSFETATRIEEGLKAGLKRDMEAPPPQRESREDKTVTVFRLRFAGAAGEPLPGGRR